jgi:hypothetical protein
MAGGTKYKSITTKITRDLPMFQEDMETCEEGCLRGSYFIQIIAKSLHGICCAYSFLIKVFGLFDTPPLISCPCKDKFSIFLK